MCRVGLAEPAAAVFPTCRGIQCNSCNYSICGHKHTTCISHPARFANFRCNKPVCHNVMNNLTNTSYSRLRIYYNDLSLNLKTSPSSYIVTTWKFTLFWLLPTFTLILVRFYSHALLLLQMMISKNSTEVK